MSRAADPESKSRIAEASLLLITIVWGTTFPLLRTSLRLLDPWDILALRFSIGAVLIAAIYARRFTRLNKTALRDGFITGAFMGAGYLTQAIGLTTVSSPRSAFLTGTAVIFVPFVDRFVSKLGVTRGEGAAVALVFVGLLIFYADAGLTFRAGDLWTLAGALMFACQVVTTNVAARRSDPFVVSALQSAVAATLGWIFIGARGGLSVPWSDIPWGRVLYLGIVATAFILVLQTWALGKTKPVRAGVIYSLEPVFAAIFALAFFGEGMSVHELLGSGAILLGVLVAELKKR
jgi:drug/metabolite transporter (DMT)-like permease